MKVAFKEPAKSESKNVEPPKAEEPTPEKAKEEEPKPAKKTPAEKAPDKKAEKAPAKADEKPVEKKTEAKKAEPEAKQEELKKPEAKKTKSKAQDKATTSEKQEAKAKKTKPKKSKADQPKGEATPSKKAKAEEAAPEPEKPSGRKRDASKLKSQVEQADLAMAMAAEQKKIEAAAPKPEPKKSRAKRVAPKPVENPGKRFKRLIRETGPISLAQFMGESNALYYSSRDPFGEEGDFITAPEISQMFGELIGLWLADVWVRAGTPENVHYVELGPGRGTLALDALRTAARYELQPTVHFIEGSETLREIQSEAIPDVQHHHDLSTIPDDGPILLVANEFFDALPVHQLLRAAQGWTERMVGLDGDRFVFVGGDKPMDAIVPSSWKSAPQGTLIETSPAAAAIMSEIADRLVSQGGAALVIDYGGLEHRSGSSLQALKAHKKVDPLEMPGQADITAHVDFEMLSQIAKRQGAQYMGTKMQGDWLRELGIETRAEALERKSPAQAATIKRQRDRLISESEMGLLFKVMGVSAPDWPTGVGF